MPVKPLSGLMASAPVLKSSFFLYKFCRRHITLAVIWHRAHTPLQICTSVGEQELQLQAAELLTLEVWCHTDIS
jgi:hypothetical protein